MVHKNRIIANYNRMVNADKRLKIKYPENIGKEALLLIKDLLVNGVIEPSGKEFRFAIHFDKDTLKQELNLCDEELNKLYNVDRLSEILKVQVIKESDNDEITQIVIADILRYNPNNKSAIIASISYVEEMKQDVRFNDNVIDLIDEIISEH